MEEVVCLWNYWTFLKGCCPVSLLNCELWSFRGKAQRRWQQQKLGQLQSRWKSTSLSLSAAVSAFGVPEIELGAASTTLVGAVVFTVCETG